ncbi:hypothetical protein, partial [Companilactobacillus paralimentarius]|uniref:hypothetical protein n=1 Tax=Companilactobacillus paralimentarius TaxID=83526 RepID=UPI001F1A4924
ENKTHLRIKKDNLHEVAFYTKTIHQYDLTKSHFFKQKWIVPCRIQGTIHDFLKLIKMSNFFIALQWIALFL